jgi:hypothetical protein
MKIAAGCLVLLVAVILLGGAFMDWRDDENSSSGRMDREFREIGNDTAFYRDMAEDDSRKSSEEIRAVAGAAFLAAGLFILGTRAKKQADQKP